MQDVNNFPYPAVERTLNNNEVDYVKDGVLYKGNVADSVMIESSSDLASLTDLTPGSIAYTAGFASMWQLSASGTWVEM